MKFVISLMLFAVTAAPTPDQDKKIKRLEDKLMAPCCYSQTIRVHMSAEAEQMREEVTSMVLSGRSEKDIIRYYKAKYGETILVVPDGTSGIVTYSVPVCAFLVDSGLLMLALKRSLRRQPVLEDTALSRDKKALASDVIKRIRSELGEEV